MKYDMITLLYHIIHPEEKIQHKITYESIHKLFKFHSLEPFLQYARKLDLLEISEKEIEELNKIYNTFVYKTAVQEEEFNLIKKALSDSNISFLPLKGSLIRELYPAPELRTMADLDILVPKEKLSDVNHLMTSIGYNAEHLGGNHDVYYKKPFMNIEMHRSMIAESYEMSYYFENVWEKVTLKEQEGQEYILSEEDTYIFLVAHSAKHYGVGGTGVRSVCDIYFYLKHYNKMNFEYIQKELVKLKLNTYEKHIKAVAFGWFDGKELQENARVMGEYILHSGVYGIRKNAFVSDISSEAAGISIRKLKLKYLWKKLFLPYKTMKILFPSLKYLFILLPFYYLFRFIKGLFSGQVVSQSKELHQITSDDIKLHREIKKKTGRKQ